MPEPIEDLNRDHQCHHYQAPTGQRCGSPALKGEYYCYHHMVRQKARNNRRVLIDPEVTCMELPPIEDRASIFVALAAVIHRLAENTIDTRRSGQMLYALQIALRALEPARSQRSRTSPAADFAPQSQPAADTADASSTTTSTPGTPASVQLATNNQQLATSPTRTINISKESLLYFLRSRHCATCNAELFPASELTERRNSGAPPTIIEEARPALPAPHHSPDQITDHTPAEIPVDLSTTIPTLHAGCPVLTPLGRDANILPRLHAVAASVAWGARDASGLQPTLRKSAKDGAPELLGLVKRGSLTRLRPRREMRGVRGWGNRVRR